MNLPDFKFPSTFPRKIDNNLSLGLDLGVGSCGQALVYEEDIEKTHVPKGLPTYPSRIAFLGVRAFDIPETKEKTGVKLKNPDRRAKRLLRRTTRRRAWRMWETRKLLIAHKILPADYPTDPDIWKSTPRGENATLDHWRDWHSQMTTGERGNKGKIGPLELRVAALDRTLEPLEWAAALLHLAKHRGFRSNKKTESEDSEDGKVLQALSAHARRREDVQARTHGEMLLKHPDFADRKRNREGIYTAVAKRADQLEEIHLLFKRQRELGSTFAAQSLEDTYAHLFYYQKPLKNSLNLLGDCPFEPTEKRGPRMAFSFELCRALQRLNALTVLIAGSPPTKFPDYLEQQNLDYTDFISRFGTQKAISYSSLRKLFSLDPSISFENLSISPLKNLPDSPSEEDLLNAQQKQITDAEKLDFVARSRAAAEGTYLLRNALGKDLWKKYVTSSPKTLDHIGFALSFFETIENGENDQEFWGILNQLRADKVPDELVTIVEENLRSSKPTLHKFSGTTSMSLLASRKLIPILSEGMLYSAACTTLYGDHRQTNTTLENITNPVVKSVVREVMKQAIHLINETGAFPGKINVEIGRDLGKSVKERNEIDRAIKKRTSEKTSNAEKFKKVIGREPNPDELLAFELSLEQSGLCPYCGESLPNPLTWQSDPPDIDHILPRSRSHDNSYDNKVLVHPGCNRNKANQTPSEWLGLESPAWQTLRASTDHMPRLRTRKRRNLLNTTFATDEAKFASRHLNDTRYISKLITHFLSALYEHAGEKPFPEKGSTRRVFVQPGQLTSLVRRSWGLEDLKKDRDGQRLGDKHHAVDALICALLSEGQRQFVTRSEQQKKAAREVPIFSEFSRSYALMETKGDSCHTPRHVSPPWPDFRNDVVAALDLFTVSRRENRKGRGSLHNDTLYRTEIEEEVQQIYSRKALVSSASGSKKAVLTKLADLEKIKDIHLDRNTWLLEALTDWIDRGSPTEEHLLPRDPQGGIIRKLTFNQGKKSGRHFPQGYVTGGDQVRIDIFAKTNARGIKAYFLVPIYAYHIIQENPPNRAIVANKDEHEWNQIDDTFTFEFSLWPNSRFEIKKKPSTQKPAGEHIIGLYIGINRNTGAFMFADPNDKQTHAQLTAKTGTLLFRKIETDRLGREFIVKSEKRNWRGKTVS